MNERETKVGRRNQVLYALGQVDSNDFRWKDIEELVRTQFPTSAGSTVLNIPQILSELASREKPVIRRTPKGDSYMFVDPIYRMCLRAMLLKDKESEVVTKVEIRSVGSGGV